MVMGNSNMGRRFSMNIGKGLWVGLMLVGVLALPRLAQAGILHVEALSMPEPAPWQRGSPEQEQADDVYILDLHAGQTVATQVVLLRRAPVIKGDTDGYYDKLTRFWRATYGKMVLIDWVEIGGMKWRSLRRPSSEDGMGVFQLSTVFEGRAYSLLVFVPGTVTVLPEPAMTLLASVRFGSGTGRGGPVDEVARSPAEHWVHSRTYRFNLSGDALETVVAADAQRMGRDGMLTGYGLDYGETSVDWFVEGFEWKTVSGRVAQVPWGTRGRLEVDAPAELGDGATWTLRLTLPEEEKGISARLAMWDLCAPTDELKEVLDHLDHGARLPMERLAKAPPAGCPVPMSTPTPRQLKGVPGKTTTVVWSFPVPPRSRVDVSDRNNPRRMRLVETALEPDADRTVPGDGLLERTRLFFAYELR
jgi:hypothetical protein